MSVFGPYAGYYDLIYSDKDYREEAKFVDRLLQKYKPEAKSILDLGCGTGQHAIRLAEMGYTVQGLDRSEKMIQVAQGQRDQLSGSNQKRVSFAEKDIRDACLGLQFDVVISLFHVLSYQTSDEDVSATLDTVAQHVSPGGTCLLDFWYGPAVLSNPPEVRLKRFENEELKIIRISQPKLSPNENLVEVGYSFIVREKKSGTVSEFEETHRMRYFFMPELLSLFNKADLHIVETGEWLTQSVPNTKTWSVYIVARGPDTQVQQP